MQCEFMLAIQTSLPAMHPSSVQSKVRRQKVISKQCYQSRVSLLTLLRVSRLKSCLIRSLALHLGLPELILSFHATVRYRQQLQLEEWRVESKLRHKPDWPKKIFSAIKLQCDFFCVLWKSDGAASPPQPKVLKEQLNLKPRTLNAPSHLPSPSPPTSQLTHLPKEETPMHILGLYHYEFSTN